MSEELLQTHPKNIGRYLYYKLGNTTLNQLRNAKIINKHDKKLMNKKPDGLIVLPGGDVKAVIEYKLPSELSTKNLVKKAIEQEIEVARLLCKLLIITDGTKSYWINALNGEEIIHNGKPISFVFDSKKIVSDTITIEERLELENLIDKIDYSLSETNNIIQEPEVVDPTPLAKEVWQKIWINTGKEPEKCLYNVVEIFVFKFLSDLGVLNNYINFQNVCKIKQEVNAEEALKHYADRCRVNIKEMFPKGNDGTTIINGTIFVNEQGKANLSQATLFGQVLDSFLNFDKKHGSFKYVNKQFKTRLYETFLRQSAGIKNLGQYFTPRNVVQAMVKMSNAKHLTKGARICDPFCGVGGFILETIVMNENIYREFIPKNGKINPEITIKGFDKGTDEKDDERTIILAKANMLIYFSDLISKYNTKYYLAEYANNAFNKVFHLIRSNLGTFEKVDEEPFDLILTNPPYVTSGSSSLKDAIQKNEDSKLSSFYTAQGRGTESLAIEWIIKKLKPGGQALVIVPDGLLNQKVMINFIKKECIVEGIISLPVRTFYATPKKTYILIIKKKYNNNEEQEKPVFMYLVSEIGETRDARRFPIERNDLDEAVNLFTLHQANLTVTDSPRCKVVSFEEFNNYNHWMVDRFWSEEEKKTLGILEEREELSEKEFYSLIKEIRDFLDDHIRGDNGE